MYFILANKKLLFPTFDLVCMNTHAKTCQLLPQHGSYLNKILFSVFRGMYLYLYQVNNK